MQRNGMIVFSEGERNRQGPPKSGESHFAYLDSSARPEAEEYRKLIEDWVKYYPSENLKHWLGDFRSNDNGQHESAFFELFLIQFFQANGFKILAVEPEIKGVKGRPDLLIESREGEKLVVEAISPNNKPDSRKGKDKLIDDIKDAINAVKVQDYYLILDKIEAPIQAINKARLTDDLAAWLDSKPGTEDKYRYEDKGAVVEISVQPRPGRDVETEEYRAIGVEMGQVSVSTPGAEVKKALARKASKYRDLSFPYLIAVNARGLHDTEDDFLAATYGNVGFKISIGLDGAEGAPEAFRDSDGLFNDGQRARKKNVSAAIFFNGVGAWNWRDRRSCTIHNAYADRPLSKLTFGGDAFFAVEGKLEKVNGKNVGDLF